MAKSSTGRGGGGAHLFELVGVAAVVPGSVSEGLLGAVNCLPPPTDDGLRVHLVVDHLLSLLQIE